MRALISPAGGSAAPAELVDPEPGFEPGAQVPPTSARRGKGDVLTAVPSSLSGGNVDLNLARTLLRIGREGHVALGNGMDEDQSRLRGVLLLLAGAAEEIAHGQPLPLILDVQPTSSEELEQRFLWAETAIETRAQRVPRG